MNSQLQRRSLVVKPSTIHGYGVFAGEDIKQGEMIEECYAVILDDDSGIKDYCFKADGRSAMVLGNGAIYNHLDKNFNAEYRFDTERSAMIYTATHNITQGDEIFINYGKDWFADRYAIASTPSRRYQLRKFMHVMRRLSRGALVAGLIAAIIYICQFYALTHG